MIQSVQKAMRLLSILADCDGRPIRLGELAARAELPKPTCSHLIATLEAEGFAVRISHSNGYVLGPAAYCLSRFGRYKSELVATCRPVLQYLHQNLGYTVILAVIDSKSKYIIDCIDSGNTYEKKARIRADDIYRTATGRVILANLDADEQRRIFEKYGIPKAGEWDEVTSFETMVEQLSRIDPHGICCTYHPGQQPQTLAFGYGAALFDRHGCCGAIGVSIPIAQAQAATFAQEDARIRKLIERGVTEINRRLQQ